MCGVVGVVGGVGVVVGSGGKWWDMWSVCVVDLCGRFVWSWTHVLLGFLFWFFVAVFLLPFTFTFYTQPGIVNWEIMRGIESKEDLMHNAKYVISVARKMGATVFIAWEDIVEVNKNMLVTFVCELMAVDRGLGKGHVLTLEDTKKSRRR